MEARVFLIAQSPRFDYSSAEEFGTPVFLFEDREISPFNVDAVMGRVEERMIELEFDSRVDYIAITGPSALVSLFFFYLGGLAATFEGPIKTLLFNAGQGKYQPRVVTLPEALRGPSGGGVV